MNTNNIPPVQIAIAGGNRTIEVHVGNRAIARKERAGKSYRILPWFTTFDGRNLYLRFTAPIPVATRS